MEYVVKINTPISPIRNRLQIVIFLYSDEINVMAQWATNRSHYSCLILFTMQIESRKNNDLIHLKLLIGFVSYKVHISVLTTTSDPITFEMDLSLEFGVGLFA